MKPERATLIVRSTEPRARVAEAVATVVNGRPNGANWIEAARTPSRWPGRNRPQTRKRPLRETGFGIQMAARYAAKAGLTWPLRWISPLWNCCALLESDSRNCEYEARCGLR